MTIRQIGTPARLAGMNGKRSRKCEDKKIYKLYKDTETYLQSNEQKHDLNMMEYEQKGGTN